MADRHLRLVPTPDLAGPELLHAQAVQQAASYLARRGLSLEVTIVDEDGVELSAEPAATAARGFAARAEAHTHRSRSERHLAVLTGTGGLVKVGVSDPVPRDEFLADPAKRRSVEAEALLDLIQQLRPHPSEVQVP